MSKIEKVIFPLNEQTIQVSFPPLTKFLINYDNVLYFEVIESSDENKLEEHIFYIIEYKIGMKKPDLSEYVCSFRNNNLIYFVFEDTSRTPFNMFTKMFGNSFGL